MLQHFWRRITSRIRYRIILPFMILAGALLALLSAVTFWLNANNLQEELNQLLRTSATNTGLALETTESRLLDELRPVITGQANVTENISSTADAFATRDVEQIDTIVNLAFSYYEVDRVLAFDTAGKVMVDVASPKVRERSPSVVGTTDLARDPLIQAVLKGQVDQYGDKYSSLLQFGTDPPYTMFFVIAPVKIQRPGGVEQVVGAMMYAESLDEIVTDELPRRNNASITAVLFGDGSVLASTDPNSVDLALTPEQIALLKKGQSDLSDDIEATLFTTIERNNVGYEIVYSPLRIRRVLDGYFLVGQPRSAIDQAARNTRISLVSFAALALILVILTGLRVTRSITVPLRELVSTALQVKGGNLERRSVVNSTNELGTLSNVLNDMTDRLLDLYRTSRELGRELSIGGVLQQTAASIERIIPETALSALIVQNGAWKHYTPTTEHEIEQPFSPATLQTLQAVVDLNHNPAIKYALAELVPNARIVLPLRTAQQSLGILVVGTPTPELTMAALNEPLTAIVSMTAAAMQNAVLYSTVQEEASRNQAILQSIADGVVVFDADGRIILTNSTASTMLDLPANALIGRTLAELDVTPLQTGATEVFGDSSRTTTFYQSGRSERILSLSSAPVASHDGRPFGEVLVLHDVTAEREIDRAKTDFIATISHELRTPLTVITSYADLLLRGYLGTLSDEQDDTMRTIRLHVQAMTDVVQNVVIIANIEAGIMKPIIQPCAVMNLIEQAVQLTRKSIEGKKLTLTVDVSIELPDVAVDRDHVKIILTQLLDNARRYTATGGITVRASKQNDGVQIDIIDTGQGIAATEESRMFQRFQRGGEQSGLTSTERGIGLGLAIARLLIENIGGKIWYVSTVGKGSTFSLMLPLVHEEALHSNEYGVSTTASV